MGVGNVDFIAIVEVADVVVDVDLGEVGEFCLGVCQRVGLVLDDQSVSHLFQTLHVAGYVVFDVLDAADFEDHIFVDCVADGKFALGLDI